MTNVEQSDRDREHVFEINSDVLFKPGSAVLSDKAKSTLNEVIHAIKAKYSAGYDIRVEGHTDADPIHRSKWEDNWDLAGGRARAVLHYMASHGVPEKELGFSGYADQRPRGNDKAKNRRVEIVAIPREGGGAGKP